MILAVLLATLLGVRAGAEEVADLRGEIPTGTEVRRELAAVADERTTLVGVIARLEGGLDAAIAEREALGEEGLRLAAEIETTEARVRELVVVVFVAGDPTSDFSYLLDVDEASDLSWRRYLVRNATGNTNALIERLMELKAKADGSVLVAVEEADAIRTELAEVQAKLVALDARQAAAESMLVIAEAWDRAEIAITEGPYGFAPADKWEQLRFCESTHNYQAVSPSGVYRGAYQFDVETWQTVGGTGDPAMAPPAEQDARARELYARRGDQPWPICGFHLK